MQSNPGGTKQKDDNKGFKDALAGVRKLFKILRHSLRILSEILMEILNTAVFLVSIAFKFISSPSMPCILSISLFGIVLVITAGQWARTGLWVASILGISNIYGQGAIATAGMFAGLCINIFQMSSEMWRISRRFADYYAKKGVDVKLEGKDEDVRERLSNWLSYDHKNLKLQRRVSYLIETGLVVTTSLLFQPSFFSLLLGAVALFLPEMSLKFVSSTISLLGGVSNQDDGVEQDYV